MSGRWWRAYEEAIDDPKLLLLPSDAHRWAWFCLCSLASAYGGVLPPIEVVALKLRKSKHKAAEIITALRLAGLVDERPDGKLEPHNWSGRQFKSDADPTASQRKRNQRARDKGSGGHNPVTRDVTDASLPPETETETETERSSLRSLPRKRGEQLPPTWVPSDEGRQYARSKGLSDDRIDAEGERFRDHSLKKGTVHKNVEAAWRNWVTSPYARPAASGAPRPGSKEDNRERTAQTLRQLDAYLDAHPDDQEPSREAGEADARLLPFAKPA